MGMVQDRVAIVTGASRGIGKAIALKLAEEGAKVVINYSRSDREAEETKENLSQLGVDYLMLKGSVVDRTSKRCKLSHSIRKPHALDCESLLAFAFLPKAV